MGPRPCVTRTSWLFPIPYSCELESGRLKKSIASAMYKKIVNILRANLSDDDRFQRMLALYEKAAKTVQCHLTGSADVVFDSAENHFRNKDLNVRRLGPKTNGLFEVDTHISLYAIFNNYIRICFVVR